MHGEAFAAPIRRVVLTSIVLLAMAILFFRLYQLQLIYHTEFGRQSEENSIRTIVKEPIRGYMFDRNEKLMVDVGPAYGISITPAEFNTAHTKMLSLFLNIDELALQDRVNKGRIYSRFSPARVKRDLSFQTLSALEERSFLLSGISFSIESKRVYPTPARASHLLGYCKEISDAQLTRGTDYYSQGDIIGSSGLEASYETLLRGRRGYEFVSANANGQVIGAFDQGRSDIRPREGFDLYLGVDAGLQAFAESLMTEYRGGLVAVDPSTGSILALVSKPDFDLSVFSGVTPPELWNALNSDSSKPLFNRSTMTNYPPGSTYKMVLAAAALQEGIIDENTRINCSGAYRFGNRVFKDLKIHGSTNVVEAIQKSCNVFFYQLIQRVGLDKWTEYGRKFGFGVRTGIDIGEENPGLLPSGQYFDRVYGKGKWTLGYLVSLSIGQGEIGVSPLQVAMYTAAIANGGMLHQPHAVNFIRNKQTSRLERVDYRSQPVGLSPKVVALIREGMRRAVESPGGTAGNAKIVGVVSAGKTGTAQNPHGDDHAWYVGFAPYEAPTIAVAVMLENAGFGGAKAAPVASKVMERYIAGFASAPPVPPERKQASKDSSARITQAGY